MSTEDDIRSLISLLSEGAKYEIRTLNADDLSRLQCKLAVLRAKLSDEAADAVYDSNYATIYRKFQHAEKFNALKALFKEQEEKITDGVAEKKTEEMIFEIRKDEMEKRRRADKLTGLLDSTDKMVFVVHDRLRQLDAEFRQAGRQEG